MRRDTPEELAAVLSMSPPIATAKLTLAQANERLAKLKPGRPGYFAALDDVARAEAALR
jgi:hypothetical protein